MTPKKPLTDLIIKEETPTELGVPNMVASESAVGGVNTTVYVGSQIDGTRLAVETVVTPNVVDVATNNLVEASLDPTSLLQGM